MIQRAVLETGVQSSFLHESWSNLQVFHISSMDKISSKLSRGLSAVVLISEFWKGRDAVICPFMLDGLC